MADVYLFVVVILMLTPPNDPSDQRVEAARLVITSLDDENSQIIHAIQDEYQRLLQEPSGQGNWRNLSETELWLLLCRCILSADLDYETALSTVETAWKNGQLNPYMLADLGAEKGFVKQLSTVLGSKKLGKRISLYFIANARKWRNHNLFWILNDSPSEDIAREELCRLFKGVGLTEASRFLRDSCYAKDIIVLDETMIRFLKMMQCLEPDADPSKIEPQNYQPLEYLFTGYCKTHGVDHRRMERAIGKVLR